MDGDLRIPSVGSPPLARRALGRVDVGLCRERLTSARAESTRRSPAGLPGGAAHLRSRGEHCAAGTSPPHTDGSPPLARRARRAGGAGGQAGWLTSARAESTAGNPGTRTVRPAHLRSRGEHWPRRVLPRPGHGSPPLARRARGVRGEEVPHDRLTSARAESTLPRGTRAAAASAHLRSRGEHSSPSRSCTPQTGSPPLARRAPDQVGPERVLGRLTSARAESTTTPRRSSRTSTAHLRSRGEHQFCLRLRLAACGSPPLARRAREKP